MTQGLAIRRSGMGHEDLFAPPRLSAGYRLGKPTFAGTQGNGRDAPGAVIVSPNCAIYPLSPRTVTKQRWSERTLGLCGLSRSRSIRRSPASYAASDNDSSCEFRSRNCKADSSSARSRSRWTCRRATSTPAKPVAFNSETIALGGQKSAKSRVSPPGNRRNTASRLTPADTYCRARTGRRAAARERPRATCPSCR